MRIDLSELDRDNSREFLDYFNAALRSKSGIPFPTSGSAGFTEEGYEAKLDDWIITSDGGSIAVTWKILLEPDGSAVSIDVVSDSDVQPEIWEPNASKFISEILVSVLSGRKEHFFRRRHFAAISGSNLPGEYWLPGYRFAPQFPDDDSSLINAERYLVIDQEIEAIDSWHVNELADERSAIASAHLSLITDVGIYKPNQEHKWFISREEGGIGQSRESTQQLDFKVPDQMPEKGELCEHVKFEGSVFEYEMAANNKFTCPQETRTILRGLNNANPAFRSAFDNCSMLYQLALTIGRYHPTVRISYECASVDAVVQVLSDEYASFSDFVRKNIDEDVESLLDTIHGSIRSAHWHGGQFALGETDHRQDSLTNPQGLIRFNLIRESHRVIRTAIFNWVMKQIGDDHA